MKSDHATLSEFFEFGCESAAESPLLSASPNDVQIEEKDEEPKGTNDEGDTENQLSASSHGPITAVLIGDPL